MNKARFFVVIHALTTPHGLNHCISQTKVAKDGGADGIFLIPDYEKGLQKKATDEDLVLYFTILKQKFPGFPIGLNFLKRPNIVAEYIYGTRPDFLQSDSSSLEGLLPSRTPLTEFFCGVAFKYSKNEHLSGEKLKEHCERVASVSDVPTTSGVGTGKPALISKIKEIRSYLPLEKRLGIASGVTTKNVQAYLDAGVTDFLVATSLCDHIDENGCDILNPEELVSMAKIIHGG